MIDLALAFMGGLLGSSHCIGMCGGFVVSIGAAAPSAWSNLRRQLAYGAGRIFTYSALGAAAGFGGSRLAGSLSPLANVQAGLAIFAGLLLVAQGLISAGVIRLPRKSSNNSPCLMRGFFGSFLKSPGLQGAFLAGLFTGFLPCGLVYAWLALAASSAHPAAGLAVMAAFGCGTAPLLTLFGCGSSLLSLSARGGVLRVAAWCIVLAGGMSLVRGIGPLVAESPSETCPFCQSEADVADRR
jgi:hypothetical protein